ncbi:MAG: DUF255 domain-containing protein [Saprospiraceae bacterium]|nr:DUF255 domain-containing protein [Saprospiraceae bacterium]
MKYRLLSVFAFFGLGFFLLTSFTQPKTEEVESVKWYSFEDAIELSKDNPKKIVVDVYATWCGPCKIMDKKVFGDPAVAKYLNENFYPVKFDGESKESVEFEGKEYTYLKNGRRGIHELALALTNGRPAYPTVIFMDEDHEVINRVTGVQPKDMFEKYLEYLNTDAYKSQDWFEYSGQN